MKPSSALSPSTVTARLELARAICAVLTRAWQLFKREEIKPVALERLSDEWAAILAEDIPASRLEETYNRWVRTKRPRFFPTPQDLLTEWDELVDEAAQASFATKRQAPAGPQVINGQTVYNCPHCCDQTEQPVWQHARMGWYHASRGCGCAGTPANRRVHSPIKRSEYRVEGFVLSECGRWICRDLEGRWAEIAALQQYGAPSFEWALVIQALKSEHVEV